MKTSRVHNASHHLRIVQYARAVHSFNRDLSEQRCRWLAIHVLRNAQHHRIDPRLVLAVVAVESRWRPYAVSEVGARGLGQLMPSTAAELGVHADQPFENLAGTTKYLAALRDRFAHYGAARQYKYAIGAYNAGPNAVAFYRGIPPYAETRGYVEKVLHVWHELTRKLNG